MEKILVVIYYKGYRFYKINLEKLLFKWKIVSIINSNNNLDKKIEFDFKNCYYNI